MKDFNVPRFIHHLGCAVHFSVEELHRLGDLCSREECTLFAVQELAEHPCDSVVLELDHFVVVELDAELIEFIECQKLFGHDWNFGVVGIDVGMPRPVCHVGGSSCERPMAQWLP